MPAVIKKGKKDILEKEREGRGLNEVTALTMCVGELL